MTLSQTSTPPSASNKPTFYKPTTLDSDLTTASLLSLVMGKIHAGFVKAADDHDMTQTDLARLAGMSPAQLNRILNRPRNAKLSTLSRIMTALGIYGFSDLGLIKGSVVDGPPQPLRHGLAPAGTAISMSAGRTNGTLTVIGSRAGLPETMCS